MKEQSGDHRPHGLTERLVAKMKDLFWFGMAMLGLADKDKKRRRQSFGE